MTGAKARIRAGNRRVVLASALMVATALASAPVAAPAWAQQPAASTAAIAQLQSEQSFDIPAQPLTDALVAFGRQSGIQVTVDGTLARNVSSPAVRGTMTSQEALTRLLAGSGLTYVVADDSTVAIERPGEQDDDGPIVLDPVTVEGKVESAYGPVEGYVATRSATGTKTDTPISEVPQSVSVVTRDQIDIRGARTLAEALSYSPVVTGTRGESSTLGDDNIVIRGFGGTGSANEYWDGLQILGTNFAISGIEPYLFERVEALRGPTSVLYGQNQPGGIVNSVSKRPPNEFQGEAQILGGSFNTKELDVEVGGPVTPDSDLSFLLVGVLSDQDAQTDFSGRERQVVAPTLSWQPSERTSVTAQFVYQKDDANGGAIRYLPAAGTLFPNPNGEIPRERYTGDPNFDKWDREIVSAAYVFEHEFSDTWSVRQNARYLQTDADTETIYAVALLPDNRTIRRSAFGVKETSDLFAIDNQVLADFETGELSHKLLVGADIRYREGTTFRRFSAAPTLDLFAPVYFQTIPEPPISLDADEEQFQAGVYIQDQIKFQRWILTLGGRHDWADSKITENRFNITEKTKDTAFTGRVGLGYAFENGFTPYFSFSQSFLPQSGTDFNGNNFEPTEGQQYEAGVKFDVPGENAFITLALFELTQQNVLTSDPNNPGFNIQTGEIRSRGVEFEAVASLTSGWDIAASYTYLDQEVTKSNDTDLGKRPRSIPEQTGALWINYTFDSGWAEGLQLGSGVRFTGRSAGDRLNTFDVPSFTLFDASLNYDLSSLSSSLSGWKVAVNATNLADRTYVASCFSENACYYGIGRSVIGRLKFEW